MLVVETSIVAVLAAIVTMMLLWRRVWGSLKNCTVVHGATESAAALLHFGLSLTSLAWSATEV